MLLSEVPQNCVICVVCVEKREGTTLATVSTQFFRAFEPQRPPRIAGRAASVEAVVIRFLVVARSSLRSPGSPQLEMENSVPPLS